MVLFSIFSFSLNLSLAIYCWLQWRNAAALCVDPTYGVLSRQGLERRWNRLSRHYQRYSAIFLDLDKIHVLNQQLGYAEVDRRIRQAFACLRRSEICGRWYSGDEIVLLVPHHEAGAAAHRIQAALADLGLSATFGVCPCQSRDLPSNVKGAATLVQQRKSSNQRGGIAGLSNF